MGQPMFPAVPSRPARVRQFYITSDEPTNTILVTGPPEIIAKAKDIVENRLDKPNPDVKNPQPILTGPPSFENIPAAQRQRGRVRQGFAGHLPRHVHAAHLVGWPQRPPRLRLPRGHGSDQEVHPAI